MGLRSDHTSGTTCSPVGQTPVVKGTGKRLKTNMIVVVSNTGTLRFRVFQERFTGPVFLGFIKRLVKHNAGRKVHLIVDGHPAHRARLVRDWVAERPDLIELHFLPGYAPAAQPGRVPQPGRQGQRARSPPAARPRSARGRGSRQRQPRQVAKYFHERHVTRVSR